MNKLLMKCYGYIPDTHKKWIKLCYFFITEHYRLFIAKLKFTMVWLFIKTKKIENINLFEQKIYSQNGEDGIIRIILYKIGIFNKFCVEFGVGDGHECNTRYLIGKESWQYLHMDSTNSNNPFIKNERITAENINHLFDKYNVPKEFDLLSIDIDYNTYWVWKSIKGYYPRLVVIEYNSSISPSKSQSVKYDPNAVWDGTDYFGASLLALVKLGKLKGYTLVGCDNKGVNAFFVRSDLIKNHFIIRGIKKLYKPPKYGRILDGTYSGHQHSSKSFLSV